MSPQTPEDREALQREIQAAIAAGRDLDPEMDQHLADSALDRYSKEKAARDRAVGVRAPHPPAAPAHPNPNLELIVRSLGSIVIIGGIIIAVVLTHGAALGFWWLIFLFGPLWGWRGRRWSGRHRYSYSGGYQPQQIPDEDAERRRRETQRQDKIAQLESEIKRLKHDDYV